MGLSYEASLISRYAGAGSRLGKPMGKPRRVNLVAPAAPVVAEPEPLPAVPISIHPLDPPAWKVILRQVADKYDVTVADICSAKRHKQITPARYEAAYRMRYEADMSLPQIGKRLGGRDHTTALHGIRMHEAFLEGVDPKLAIKKRGTRPAVFWNEERKAKAIGLKAMGKTFDYIAQAVGASSAGAVKNFFQRQNMFDFYRSLGAVDRGANQ